MLNIPSTQHRDLSSTSLTSWFFNQRNRVLKLLIKMPCKVVERVTLSAARPRQLQVCDTLACGETALRSAGFR